jgi:hypothetical protein
MHFSCFSVAFTKHYRKKTRRLLQLWILVPLYGNGRPRAQAKARSQPERPSEELKARRALRFFGLRLWLFIGSVRKLSNTTENPITRFI